MEPVSGMQPNVQVGERDVLDSGVVTSPDNKPITIQIAENVKVEFRFDYEGDSDPKYSAEPIDGKLVITLTNFMAGVTMGGTTPPVGIVEPMSIGELFGRELFLMFQVSTIKSENNVINSILYYNFYLENPQEDDTDGGE